MGLGAFRIILVGLFSLITIEVYILRVTAFQSIMKSTTQEEGGVLGAVIGGNVTASFPEGLIILEASSDMEYSGLIQLIKSEISSYPCSCGEFVKISPFARKVIGFSSITGLYDRLELHNTISKKGFIVGEYWLNVTPITADNHKLMLNFNVNISQWTDTSIAELITIPFREKYLILCHTQDYLIKIFDVQSKEIIRSFTRKYDRVKVPEGRQVGGRIGVGGKMYSAPRKYLNDISKIFEFKNNLWIMTSSADKDKGILMDVNNFEGQYLDNFYLKFHEEIDPISLGSRPMTISGNNLYMLVRNEDETYSIKKFLIENKIR